MGVAMRGLWRGFTLVEVLVVIAIVAMLALLALPGFSERAVREQVAEVLDWAEVARKPVATAWATAKVLPADNAEAGLPAADKMVSNLVQSVAVRQGAINITFGNNASSALKGKVLTLRPAVVDDAPVVPVAWVCAAGPVPEKMSAKGDDRTTVPPALLPVKCRARVQAP